MSSLLDASWSDSDPDEEVVVAPPAPPPLLKASAKPNPKTRAGDGTGRAFEEAYHHRTLVGAPPQYFAYDAFMKAYSGKGEDLLARTFPVKKAQEIREALAWENGREPPPLLLIVGEDSSGKRTLTRHILKNMGYSVFNYEAAKYTNLDNQTKGLKEATSRSFSLMDVGIPGVPAMKKGPLKNQACIMDITAYMSMDAADSNRDFKGKAKAGAMVKWLNECAVQRVVPIVFTCDLTGLKCRQLHELKAVEGMKYIRTYPPTRDMLKTLVQRIIMQEVKRGAVSSKNTIETPTFLDWLSRVSDQGTGGYSRVLVDTFTYLSHARVVRGAGSGGAGMSLDASGEAALHSALYKAGGSVLNGEVTLEGCENLARFHGAQVFDLVHENAMVHGWRQRAGPYVPEPVSMPLLWPNPPEALLLESFTTPRADGPGMAAGVLQAEAMERYAKVMDTFAEMELAERALWRSPGILKGLQAVNLREVGLMRSTPLRGRAPPPPVVRSGPVATHAPPLPIPEGFFATPTGDYDSPLPEVLSSGWRERKRHRVEKAPDTTKKDATRGGRLLTGVGKSQAFKRVARFDVGLGKPQVKKLYATMRSNRGLLYNRTRRSLSDPYSIGLQMAYIKKRELRHSGQSIPDHGDIHDPESAFELRCMFSLPIPHEPDGGDEGSLGPDVSDS